MRKIKPYIFEFETHAKGRWIGKKLMDVFLKEFRFETPLYYVSTWKLFSTCIWFDGNLISRAIVYVHVYRHLCQHQAYSNMPI